MGDPAPPGNVDLAIEAFCRARRDQPVCVDSLTVALEETQHCLGGRGRRPKTKRVFFDNLSKLLDLKNAIF